MFGFALHAFGGRGTLIFDLVEKISHVFFGIVGIIMKAGADRRVWRDGLHHRQVRHRQHGFARQADGHVLCDLPDFHLRRAAD